MSSPRLPSPVLFVADASQAPRGLPALVARAAAAGLESIEIRRKSGAGAAERLEELERVREAAPEVNLLVNDRVDLALAIGAEGVHVGRDDLHPVDARRLLGAERLLGLSTHDASELDEAADWPLDYVAVGPIFPSSTKSGHAPVVGLSALADRCRRSPRPVVAIGGITVANAGDVFGAGAAAVAVAAGLARGDIARAARTLLEEGERAAGPAQPWSMLLGVDVSGHWFLAGLSGAGKSVTGRALARRSGRRFVDLDEDVERRSGRTVSEVFARQGPTAFRALEEESLRHVLAVAGMPLVVALGGGTLEHAASRELVLGAGRVAWLDASPSLCARRLVRDGVARRPLLAAADSEPALAAVLGRLLAARRTRYAAAAVRVDASAGVEVVVSRLLDAFASGAVARRPS